MFRKILVLVAVGGLLTSAFAVSDTVWGEAWNTASVIGLSNMTIDSNQKWGNDHNADGKRGAATELFDNVNDTNNDLLHTMSNGKLWVKMTVAAGCQAGKDLVLKKYRMSAGSNVRSPKTWSIYGSANPSAAWGDKSLVLIDSRANVAGTTSADYDCSANAGAFSTYFFYFEANNGDGLLQICELYLFGEIKDHEEAIVYSVSLPYSGFYDGYAHGLTVTSTYPETGVTIAYSADGETWQAESPAYKDVGEYTIYYRLTASGFPDVSGSRILTILEPPQENLQIIKTVRDAESASGTTYHEISAVGQFFNAGQTLAMGDPGNFIDNVVKGQKGGWANGSGSLTYRILDTYRPGDTVVVTGITFMCQKTQAFNGTAQCMPRNWKLEAYDAADGTWRELVSYANNAYPEWTDDDVVVIDGADCYRRTTTFENPGSFSSRQYRFTVLSGRTHLAELELVGNVAVVKGIAAVGSDFRGEYDGGAHGITVKVSNPSSGYAVFYRTDAAAEWSADAPTFVGPISAGDAKTVFWKVEAEGYESVEGSNKVIIECPDLTAKIREAGAEYSEVEATGNFGTAAQFVDGNENQRIGWTGGSDGVFTYVVSDTYEQGKAVVVKGVGFAVSWANVSSDGGYEIMPRYFALEGWNEDAQCWSTIVDRREDPLPEWSEDDKVDNVYRKRFEFDNPYAFRTYRLLMPKRHRQHVAEIKLFGIVAASSVKEILCTASDYDGLYDGAKHGISVTVTRPAAGAVVEYSLTGTDGWSEMPPLTKGIVSVPYPVYWRVRAAGYRTKTGVNTIQITDTALVDHDLTAAICEAGKTFYGVEAANGGFWQQASVSPYNFVNGSLSDRNGWVNPTTGTGYLYLTISNEFRVAESIIVKAVAFAGPTNGNNVIDNSKIVLPTTWTIEGSNDGETWTMLGSYNAENYPAWGADDIVGVNYYRRSDLTNTTSYRRYRLGFTGSRTHISEIYLYGDIGTPHPERPPRKQPGLTLLVR